MKKILRLLLSFREEIWSLLGHSSFCSVLCCLMPFGYKLQADCLRYVCNTVFCKIPLLSLLLFLFQAYGQQFIRDDFFMATVNSFAAVANCLSRVFWGVLVDRVSSFTLHILISRSFTLFTIIMFADLLPVFHEYCLHSRGSPYVGTALRQICG